MHQMAGGCGAVFCPCSAKGIVGGDCHFAAAAVDALENSRCTDEGTTQYSAAGRTNSYVCVVVVVYT